MSDLISRQAAIDALREYIVDDDMDENVQGFNDGISCAISELSVIPSAQPERKTGRWIDYIGKDLGIEGQWLRNDGKTVFVQCNQCDSLFVRNLMIHANYCPNCGAEMGVEDA